MRIIICLFLLLMPFTNAFALNSVLSPSFAVSLLLGAHFFYKRNEIVVSKPPFLLYLWIILFFSLLTMSSGEKSLNHFFLWTYPFLIYYFVFKNELNQSFTLEEIKYEICKIITIITLFSCIFSVFEFVCTNIFSVEMSFIPRGSVEEYTPFDFGFYRARSFAEESGHFAFFLEIFSPISVYWICKYLTKSYIKISFYIILTIGLFTTMSAVGVLSFFIYLFLLYQHYFFYSKSRNANKIVLILFLTVFVTIILVMIPDLFNFVVDIVKAKMDPDNVSYSDRSSRFEALHSLTGISLLIGYGPAAFSTLDVESFISFYLGVLMNTGVLGLLSLLLFLISKYNTLSKIKDDNLKIAFRCSFLLSCMHLMFIDIIYIPWFWVMISLIDVIRLKENLNC